MATDDNKKKDEQPDAVEQSIRNMESRAQELRNYAASPVNIDTSGQPNWMAEVERVRNEYMESPEHKAAREKRERTNRRIAAISDGLVALSNVAGAMAGATPIKPSTSLSEAHRIAVERAAKRRRENAARYESARKYYAGMQSQQDKLNADRYNDAVKARLNAGKQADTLQATAARLRQTKANADRADERARQRQQEQERHNRESEMTARVRAARSGGSRGGGNEQNDDLQKAYKYWESLTPEQKQQYRKWNNRLGTEPSFDVATNKWVYKDKPDDKNFIQHVWRQRQGWLRNQASKPSGKKTISGFGGSQSSGKKKIVGFGNKE